MCVTLYTIEKKKDGDLGEEERQYHQEFEIPRTLSDPLNNFVSNDRGRSLKD